MDFEFDEDQTEIQGLAKRIVADHSSPEHLTEIEAEHGGVDRPLLRALGEAGLLGLALQEDAGGAGLTFVDACLVLEEVGRHAAAAPVLENILSALAIDAFADETLRREWLPALSGGERVVAPALVDGSRDPRRPATTATRLPDGGYRLDGTKVCVTTGMAADALLVSATIAGGASTGVFLVPTDAHGITRDGQMT
ncbi:MAG TPA: acyl-CoA dehydrogenase family protein, partial [Acidimicrobiales bacterium]|nr:acyl-CoA dehydrogenase family protein [Acidimicrobiales bacterium]